MEFYRRKLPHWQISGAEYFVTIRLFGSLPVHVIRELQQKRRQFLIQASKNQNPDNDKIEYEKLKKKLLANLFKKYEKHLDNAETGPTWLKQSEVANIIKEAIHFRDQKEYDLYTYCIMSNHIHLVFRHLDNVKIDSSQKNLLPVTQIMKNFKSYTGLQANKYLNRTGSFWQDESFDRLIRSETELENVIRYTINNPVKINLIKDWKNWPHSYCKPEFLEGF
jgi:putative transposase